MAGGLTVPGESQAEPGLRIMDASGRRTTTAAGIQRMTDGEDDDCCCTCDICGCGESKIRVIIDITETFYASEDGTGTPTRTLTEQQDRTLTGILEGSLEYWPGDSVVDGFPFWDFVFSNATLTTILGYACPKATGGFGLIGGWDDPRLISLPLVFADIFGPGQGNNFCYYDPFDETQEVTYSRELWALYFGAGDAFLDGEDSAKYTVRIRISCVESAYTCGGCGYNDDTLAAATFTLTGVYRQTGWTALDCSSGQGMHVPESIITWDGPHEITKTPGEELTIGGKTVPGATFASSIYFPDVGSYLRVDKIYWSCTTGSWHMVMTSPGSAGDILNLFPDEAGVADIDIGGGGDCDGFNITMSGCYNYPIVEGEQTTGPNGELSTYVELDLGLTTDFACDMELYT